MWIRRFSSDIQRRHNGDVDVKEGNKGNKMIIQVDRTLNLSEEEFKIFVSLLIKSKGAKTREILCQMCQERGN